MDQLTAPKDAFPTPCSSSQVEAGNQLVGKCHFWFRKHLSTQRELLPLPQGMLFSLRSCSERWQTLDSFARFLKSCAKRTPSCTESRRSGSVSYESQIHVKHKYLQGRQEQLVQLLLQLAGILWPRGKKKRIFYHLLLFLKLPLYQTTDLCNLLTICTENVLLAFFSSFPLPSSILPSLFCLIHWGDEQFHYGFSVCSPIERKQGGVLAPFLHAPSLYS